MNEDPPSSLPAAKANVSEPAAPSRGPRRSRLTKSQKLFGLGLTGAIALAVFLGLLEIMARLATLAGAAPFGDWAAMPGVDFKLKPRVHNMNREGFRDVDRDFKKPDGVFRAIFLGDSYVWGTVQREDNFPAMLERDLNALGPDRKIEIVNLGVPGYGPRDALNLWKNYGARYEPDAVLCGFLYANDITDNAPGERYRAILGERALVREGRLLDRSYLWSFFKVKAQLMRYNATHEPTGAASPISEKDLEGVLMSYLPLFDVAEQSGLDAAYGRVQAVFAEMKQFSEESGAPLMLLRFPAILTADRAGAEKTAKAAGRDPAEFDWLLPNERIDEIIGALGFPSGDITEQMTRAQAVKNLYRETHWTPEGNAAAAKAMLPMVKGFFEANGLKFSENPATEVTENTERNSEKSAETP